MNNDFKKKLDELAKAKKDQYDKQKLAAEDLLQKQRELQQSTKIKFYQAKTSIIVPIVKQARDSFQVSGDTFRLFDNENATSMNDRIRMFVQIFYYPRGRRPEVVGFNTASLLFECLPNLGKVEVKVNTSLSPLPLQSVQEINIDDFSKEIIEMQILDFINKITGN